MKIIDHLNSIELKAQYKNITDKTSKHVDGVFRLLQGSNIIKLIELLI